jgi:hypothetical protein
MSAMTRIPACAIPLVLKCVVYYDPLAWQAPCGELNQQISGRDIAPRYPSDLAFRESARGEIRLGV